MKPLRCSCERCGQQIEYPAENVGTVIDCPYCKRPTTLTVEVDSGTGSSLRTKYFGLVITLLAVLVILVLVAPYVFKLLAKKSPHGAIDQVSSARIVKHA